MPDSVQAQYELGLAMARAQETEALPNRRRLELIPVVTEFAQLLTPTLGQIVVFRASSGSDRRQSVCARPRAAFAALGGSDGICAASGAGAAS